MKTVVLYTATTICAVAGFGLGYDRKASSPATTPPLAQEAIKPTATKTGLPSTAERPSVVSKSPTPALKSDALTPAAHIASIQEIMKFPSYTHVNGALKTYFDSLPLDQFPGIYSELSKDLSYKNQWLAIVLFTAWAERAPLDGAKYLQQLPKKHWRYIGHHFLDAWRTDNPKEMREWCDKNLTGTERALVLRAIEGTPNTIDEALNRKTADEKRAALMQLFSKKASENRPLALAEMMKLSPEDQLVVMGPIITQWGKADPTSAMLWLKGQNAETLPAEKRTRLEDNLFTELVKKDPASARRFAAELPPGRRRSDQMDKIATEMLGDDPAGAIAYLDEIKAQDSSAFPGEFFKKWLANDPATATKRFTKEIAAYYERNPSGDNDWIIREMMRPWMQKDPKAAAQYAATMPLRIQSRTFVDISNFWVQQSGAEAVEWAQSLPPGETRDLAMRKLVQTWATFDTTASTAWLNSLPQDNTRWVVTRGVAASTIDNDPDLALTVIRSISDEPSRMKVLAKVWQDWSGQNKVSAEDWLKNTNLSEAERAAIAIKQ